MLVNAAPYLFNLAGDGGGAARRAATTWTWAASSTPPACSSPATRDFRRHGLLAVLGMGSAPGIANVLARAAADPLPHVRAVRVYNGGADFTRYAAPVAFGFSPATVLDEFTLPPMVFTRGRFRARAAAHAAARTCCSTWGCSACTSSLHSEVATLPLSYRAKGMRECFFKIAYDPALIERLKLLIDLGLTRRRPGPARGGSARRAARLLRGAAPGPATSSTTATAWRWWSRARTRKGPVTRALRPHRPPQRRPPLSAVARDTGFPPAIVAGLILDGPDPRARRAAPGTLRARAPVPRRPRGARDARTAHEHAAGLISCA